MMEYKGYQATVEFDDDEMVLVGTVLHLQDVITFQATDVDELEKGFRVAVDAYLEYCAEVGQEPDKPYSGRILVRVSPELHRKMVTASVRAEAVSVNAWIVSAMERAVATAPEPSDAPNQLIADIIPAAHKTMRAAVVRLFDLRGAEGLSIDHRAMFSKEKRNVH